MEYNDERFMEWLRTIPKTEENSSETVKFFGFALFEESSAVFILENLAITIPLDDIISVDTVASLECEHTDVAEPLQVELVKGARLLAVCSSQKYITQLSYGRRPFALETRPQLSASSNDNNRFSELERQFCEKHNLKIP